jgi:hypothetical protein
VRQSVVVKNNQSVLDQNHLIVRFLNDGAHNIIVRLEFTATLNDDSDVTSDNLVQTWNPGTIQFGHNFASGCDTTGCGVSAQDHLSAPDQLLVW